MTFQFRLLSDEVDSFQLDVEVPYDMNLLDFHKFIRRIVGYNPCEMASFFMSDSEWEKLREFTLIDMGVDDSDFDPDEDIDEMAPPVAMERVQLGQIIHNRFDRLIYVFDMFAERQFFIELLRSEKSAAGVEYPRIIELQGAAPAQFLDE